MKNTIFLLLVAAIWVIGCQTQVETEPVDLEEAKANVTLLIDKYYSAWEEENVEILNSLIADGGLYCGTDPTEILGKSAMSEMWTNVFSDTSIVFSYTMLNREINVAANGESAIVMEHVTFPDWSPNIPIRQTFHALKTGDEWVFDFIAWSFVVNNADVEKLNMALE